MLWVIYFIYIYNVCVKLEECSPMLASFVIKVYVDGEERGNHHRGHCTV